MSMEHHGDELQAGGFPGFFVTPTDDDEDEERPDSYERLPKELLIQFREGTAEDTIRMVLDKHGLQERLDLDDPTVDLSRLHAGGAPWVIADVDDAALAQVAADVLRSHAEDVLLANPVFIKSGTSLRTAAVPLLDTLLVGFNRGFVGDDTAEALARTYGLERAKDEWEEDPEQGEVAEQSLYQAYYIPDGRTQPGASFALREEVAHHPEVRYADFDWFVLFPLSSIPTILPGMQ